MKHLTTSLIALGAAMGFTYAGVAFAATPGATQGLRGAPVALSLGDAHQMTDGGVLGQTEDYALYVDGLGSEAIFCDGFEELEAGSCGAPLPADIVYSGVLDVVIPPSATGLRINFLTGETSPTPIPVFHFLANKGDPYLFGPGMVFSWGPEVVNAGVALTNAGPYLVLGSGDTVGPSSIFFRDDYGTPSVMFRYWDGMNGYLGVKFLNEETGEINYGYVHMLTTAGTGFPGMILDYAYDKSGAEITIP